MGLEEEVKGSGKMEGLGESGIGAIEEEGRGKERKGVEFWGEGCWF